MSYRKPSSEFNRLFAEAFVDHFGDGFVAVEDDKDEDESLLFRGPHPDDHSRLTTHVIVALQEDVRASIEIAAPNSRAEMIKNLIRNLGTQLRATYDPKDLRTFAKRIEGTTAILHPADGVKTHGYSLRVERSDLRHLDLKNASASPHREFGGAIWYSTHDCDTFRRWYREVMAAKRTGA